MQLNKGELQKVRVKLSKDALTIQKEGGPPYSSPNAQQITGSGGVSKTQPLNTLTSKLQF